MNTHKDTVTNPQISATKRVRDCLLRVVRHLIECLVIPSAIVIITALSVMIPIAFLAEINQAIAIIIMTLTVLLGRSVTSKLDKMEIHLMKLDKIPPPPAPCTEGKSTRPQLPISAMISEADLRGKCKECRSSLKRKLLIRSLGCYQEVCSNFWGNQKH